MLQLRPLEALGAGLPTPPHARPKVFPTSSEPRHCTGGGLAKSLRVATNC